MDNILVGVGVAVRARGFGLGLVLQLVLGLELLSEYCFRSKVRPEIKT